MSTLCFMFYVCLANGTWPQPESTVVSVIFPHIFFISFEIFQQGREPLSVCQLTDKFNPIFGKGVSYDLQPSQVLHTQLFPSNTENS